MAAKRRFLTNSYSDDVGLEPEDDHHHPHQDKRLRKLPSFASVIREAVMVNYLCSALEPCIRRVVNEEVDRGLRHRLRAFSRSPSLQLQVPKPQPSTVQLAFSTNLSLPIFTGTKITGDQGNPLQIHLITGANSPATLPSSLKVEIVVLDGDFPSGNGEGWSSEEFESSILKERDGKRPLLTGELTVNVRDGVGGLGEIEFTDNSSWIRSRKFRIGARVGRGSVQGIRVKEAITEAFVVKDHRGELYKKHHPPMLEDEVWRLEKIGKDGAFHKKLACSGINTVQDFLKLSVVNPARLREILGSGMSDKMWDVTTRHARTCVMGNKRFLYKGDNFLILLNPICQPVRVVADGHNIYPPATHQLTNIDRAIIENLVRTAYARWSSLEMVEAVSNENPALLTQGDEILVEQPVISWQDGYAMENINAYFW